MTLNLKTISFSVLIFSSLFLSCSIEKRKENRQRRDDLVQRVGLFCEFVKIDSSVELDVDLNLRMSDSCDPMRPFSLTSLQDAEERRGVLYCCSLSPEAAKLRVQTRIQPTVASKIPDPALNTPAPVPYVDPKKAAQGVKP